MVWNDDILNTELRGLSDLSITHIGKLEPGQRYGSKGPITVEFEGKEYDDLTLLIMDPFSTTGKVDPKSDIQLPLPMFHPKISFEWAYPIIGFSVDEEFNRRGEITHRVLLPSQKSNLDLKYIDSTNTRLDPPLITLRRVVETSGILRKNAIIPEGFYLEGIGDPHELINFCDDYMAVLIRSVKKGIPLSDLDMGFIELTGGFGKSYRIPSPAVIK